MTLTYGEASAQLEVHDPGSGCRELVPGFGIRGLKERAELLGGELTVVQEPGFTLTLRVPLRQGL